MDISQTNIWSFHDPIIGTCFSPKQWIFGKVMNTFEWSRSLGMHDKVFQLLNLFHNSLKRLRLMISCENELHFIYRLSNISKYRVRFMLWCNNSFPFITNLNFKDFRFETLYFMRERHITCRSIAHAETRQQRPDIALLLFVSPSPLGPSLPTPRTPEHL